MTKVMVDHLHARYNSVMRFFIEFRKALAFSALLGSLATVAVQPNKPIIGAPFELTDQDGKTVSDRDFLGKYRLMFFGFTHCPGVCPLTLETLLAAKAKLRLASDIEIVFVTVDPERDGVGELKDFAKRFSGKVMTLRGDVKETEELLKKYRGYAQKIPLPSSVAARSGDYSVDHSTLVYLMGKDGENLDYFGYEMGAEEIAQRIQEHTSSK